VSREVTVSPQPTLYAVKPDAGQLAVEQVWSQPGAGPLPAGSAHLVPVPTEQGLNLLAVSAAGQVTVLRVTEKEPWFEPVAGNVDLGGSWDAVKPFTLANLPYLMAYTAHDGQFSFIPLPGGRQSQVPYRYNRRHHPGPTAGFDMVSPVVVNGGCYVLCYASDTGDVALHELRVLARTPGGSPPGTPPLLASPTWIHQWARDWTRFAFFTLGGEAFFLKTNVGKLNVNIDHVLDDPTEGTVEVGTYLHLDDALSLDIVEPFTLNGGDPYFVAYRRDGQTVLYRIHGDCQGWSAKARLQAVTGAGKLVPLRIGDTCLLLFY
jgi:hypothetical protein